MFHYYNLGIIIYIIGTMKKNYIINYKTQIVLKILHNYYIILYT